MNVSWPGPPFVGVEHRPGSRALATLGRAAHWNKLKCLDLCDRIFLSMRATLGQIEALYWIERLGSFRAAAVQLNLTQPTISLRIRSLEDALGVRVFERGGRQARLTAEGTAMLPLVTRLMDLAGQIKAHHTVRDPLLGRLRLGAPASFALSCMPQLLGDLRKHYPELTVALTVDNSVVLCQRLNAR